METGKAPHPAPPRRQPAPAHPTHGVQLLCLPTTPAPNPPPSLQAVSWHHGRRATGDGQGAEPHTRPHQHPTLHRPAASPRLRTPPTVCSFSVYPPPPPPTLPHLCRPSPGIMGDVPQGMGREQSHTHGPTSTPPCTAPPPARACAPHPRCAASLSTHHPRPQPSPISAGRLLASWATCHRGWAGSRATHTAPPAPHPAPPRRHFEWPRAQP